MNLDLLVRRAETEPACSRVALTLAKSDQLRWIWWRPTPRRATASRWSWVTEPEFTMVEWYRRDADYRAIADDLAGLLGALGAAPAGATRAAFRTLAVRDAYRARAGWDPWADWDADRFDVDMANVIEPYLRELGGGIFLTDYPVQAASLARLRGDVAERWEFYWDGVELANCFSELCDAGEQRRRFAAARAERRTLGEADYPLDEAFFGALPAIGRAAGVALGVDRLVMALTGARDIASVRAPE